MSDKLLFTKENFKKGLFTLGLKKDTVDERDYKFSDYFKSKQKITKVTKVTKESSSGPLEHGRYRKIIPLTETVEVVTEETIVETPEIYSQAKVDHTECMSHIKDQGNLGSCVGFASVAMKEGQEKEEHDKEVLAGKKDHRDGKEYDYSEAWVYWNCKKIDPWPGEEGTDLRSAMKVLNTIGVPTEKAWPYSDNKLDIGEPASWANLIARWAVTGSYWSISTLTELKEALVDSPVMIGVPVFEEWYEPASGVIAYPANPDDVLGGHAICVVGYDDEKQLVKFKNSWSIYWGDKGYGYLSYKYINDFLWSSWVAKDTTVTPDMMDGVRELV
jgi:C1A family cysteine protease